MVRMNFRDAGEKATEVGESARTAPVTSEPTQVLRGSLNPHGLSLRKTGWLLHGGGMLADWQT